MHCSHNAKIWLANAGALTTRCQRAINTRDTSIIMMGDVLQDCISISQKNSLKAEQIKALQSLLVGVDVLATLPTGFGNGLIYQVSCLCMQSFHEPSVWRATTRVPTQVPRAQTLLPLLVADVFHYVSLCGIRCWTKGVHVIASWNKNFHRQFVNFLDEHEVGNFLLGCICKTMGNGSSGVDGFLDSTSGYEILSSFGELVLLIFLKIRWMRQTRHSLKTLRPNRLTCHSNGMLLRGKKSTFQIPHKFWSVPNFSGTFGAHSVKHSASFPRKKNQVMWPDRPNENFPPPLV